MFVCKYSPRLAFPSLFTPLHLHHSPPSFVLLPFALPFIVLAISKSTNGTYSSISGGDPSPLGEKKMEAEWIQKGLLSLLLFILFCLPHVSIPSLPPFISPHPSFSHSPILCRCLRRLLWKPGAWRTVQSCVALPIVAYANRIINRAPDYIGSWLTFTSSALFGLQTVSL